MKNPKLFSSILVAGACVLTSASFAQTQNGTIPTKGVNKKEYVNIAKITLQDAINAALEKTPGKAVEAELDSENGYLVYDVKIVTTDKKTEVRVDAGDKSILKVQEKKL